jgi:hypothetical protein
MKRIIILLIIISTISAVSAADELPDELKPFQAAEMFYGILVIVLICLAVLYLHLQGSARAEAKKLDRKLLKKRYRTIIIDSVRDGIFEVVGEHLYNGVWAFDLVGEGDNLPKQFMNPETDFVPLSMKNVATGRRAIFVTTATVVDLANKMGYNPENIIKERLKKAVKDKTLELEEVYKFHKILDTYKHIAPEEVGLTALSHIEAQRKAEARAESAELKVKNLEGEVEEKVEKEVSRAERLTSAARPKMTRDRKKS